MPRAMQKSLSTPGQGSRSSRRARQMGHSLQDNVAQGAMLAAVRGFSDRFWWGVEGRKDARLAIYGRGDVV
ncbi:hypothetical protein B9J09_07095 [Xylella fastidiosa subsp. pauca]|nr:hypothetical protein B9J09_07095 [Xylella fastidiosa subsp. pauca]AVI22921.1 hypothetical protein BC375_06665 [Xylella fastidiosa]ETE31479.1 hypothetical protein B398_07180 [Xylella fastidiosa 32]KIA58267.1 hypothetical protein RA12_07065 [Xylella fastidiosa]KXB11145.1 hypothetical protein ADT32_06320 [Xylella fastidiosa]